MLEGIKAGDRIINSLGEEATVTGVKVFNSRRFRLFLDTPIVGWINEDPGKSWSYERDGKFVRDSNDRRAIDLVKVIRNGSN